MFGKVKRVFFTGVFGILYISFIAQLVYILACTHNLEDKMFAMALLSVEWLVLIAARYLSKRSSGAAQYNNGFANRRR